MKINIEINPANNPISENDANMPLRNPYNIKQMKNIPIIPFNVENFSELFIKFPYLCQYLNIHYCQTKQMRNSPSNLYSYYFKITHHFFVQEKQEFRIDAIISDKLFTICQSSCHCGNFQKYCNSI